MVAAKRSDLEFKLSQMFMVGIPDVELDKSTQTFLREYRPGGVIYFAHNYESPALTYELSESVQATREKSSLPLFIAVDHEGGKVQRFMRPFTHFPESNIIGAIDSPKLAFQVAEVMARELSAVGVNIDFHPLCDIHTRPSNPIIGKRAFGSDPELVERIASAMVRGFIAEGMVSTIKHFPGHGDTTVDSHKALPKVDQTWNQLLERELKPFIRCIKGRVDMIMTAHIQNDSLDAVYPATLSYTTLTSKLRKELRFQKIIITDDMQMDAITKHYGADEAIALAIKAGNDILLYRDLEQGQIAMDTAFKFLASGRIEAADVEASYARIIEVKERVLKNKKIGEIDTVSKIVGCEAHKQVLSEVLEKGSRYL
jgi:beta-N-acetylhexosaminidase